MPTYYLDAESGDDSRDGLTPETAWKTFAHDLAWGDTLLLKPGIVYTSPLVLPSGLTVGTQGETGETIARWRAETAQVLAHRKILRPFLPVTHAVFEAVLAAYPRPLQRDVCQISEPPLISWNDLENGQGWPESIIAKHWPGDTGDRAYWVREDLVPPEERTP